MSQRCLHERICRLGKLEKKQWMELFEPAWEGRGCCGQGDEMKALTPR